MKKVIQITMILAIAALSYFLYESIAKPIRFAEEKARRYEQVIQRLKDIRTAQIVYKDVYGNFTASFDTLIKFIKNDSLPLIRAIGEVPDTLTEAKAVELGLVIRDTIRINVYDSLIRMEDVALGKKYALDSIRFVPFTSSEFQMAIGEIETGSKVKVKVFEVFDTAPFDPEDVMQVGSLVEATNHAGNWE
ncbi:MAG TPA: hypothetical protein DDX39_00265 [Bacteroidales bacterium]|nr:MAG: hypothetical protein A2W98_03290 [Bacteroidetes bacterium GWF2_33_38]OFY72873.1 MAG: hypothetical protein A2265_04185 [Bacteroidetes bacterium RIFOXYA12_FULL_33_9]OFY91935.1 MAG: hypothetical protein A2236_02040 [Bacteroidetes bacterium RIFOXYA2_FULL_33_7]HBF87043.1 hypothetical protein [Bacteroidales bacterium]